MNQIVRTLLIGAVGAASLILAAGAAQAKDCEKVTFKLTNNTGAIINFRSLKIAGSEKTWTEDYSNKRISIGKSHTTNARKMIGLAFGETPDYQSVSYDKWDAKNKKWLRNKSRKFTEPKACRSGMTYTLVLN